MKSKQTRRMVLAAMFAAITAVAAQMVIPLGFTPVPFTLAIPAIFLTGALLKPKTAFLAQAAYLLAGAMGAPVFSYFGSGLQKLAGPTGGYLLAYPFMALLVAVLAEKWGRTFWKFCVAMALSLIVCYAIGTVQLMALTGSGLLEGLMMAVVPFVAFDLAKVGLAAALSVALSRALRHAGLLSATL